MPGNKRTLEHWLSDTKLATVIETSSLSEYCRSKGFYVEQVKAWRSDSLKGFINAQEQTVETRRQHQTDCKQIKQLQHELNRKEKALAETAALLVLRKNLDAFWENDYD